MLLLSTEDPDDSGCVVPDAVFDAGEQVGQSGRPGKKIAANSAQT